MLFDFHSLTRQTAITTLKMRDHSEEKKECPDGNPEAKHDAGKQKDSHGNDSWTQGPPPLASLNLSSDQACGHSAPSNKPKSGLRRFFDVIGTLLRCAILDFPLMLLFAAYVGSVLVHFIHDEYLLPQLKLMRFRPDDRDYTDTTYYHRICKDEDITANSIDELLLPPNATAQDAVAHIMTHGASMFSNLLSPETSWALREYIDEQNYKQEGWYVIENEYRYSWGIDMDMHPALRLYWKELAANKQLVEALEAIMGPDPAIIEFTAITSAYGAVDQYDHQDVVPPASGTKYARTFVPSYSLFIPLQDTSYDMGATHICPGTHLCSKGCSEACPSRNLALSGENGIWRQGWGALINQQTTHKGMGHSKKGALDRVVIIATFAPRPQTHRALETRMIGQGGSYSIKWDHWGHTFSDFVHSETRMTWWKRLMRCLGIIKGNGYNWVQVASMRISNGDNGYDKSTLKRFRKSGGFWFLPQSWQIPANDFESKYDSAWYKFLYGTVKRTETNLKKWNIMALGAYIVTLLLADAVFFVNKRSGKSTFAGGIVRLVFTYGLVLAVAYSLLRTVQESNWGKDIQSYKAYRLPVYVLSDDSELPETIPASSDILIAPHYSKDYLAGYAHVLDYAHRGNQFWKQLTKEYSSGYAALSEGLQHEFCNSFMKSVQTNRRVLEQDLARSWIPVEDEEEILYFCRRSLLTAGNPFLEAMMYQVDGLEADAHYGRFQSTAMMVMTAPEVLSDWENVFIPLISFAPEKTVVAKKNNFLPRNFAVLPDRQEPKVKRQPIPPQPPRKEPFPGAWIQTGDIVEGRFHCRKNEWYKGTVLRAMANNAQYMVEYEDGDIDEGLMAKCVRRFVPYVVGDAAQVRSDGTFHPGTVVKVHDDERYDIMTDTTLHERMETRDMRRVSKTEVGKFFPGNKVMAQYNQGDEWFPGKIIKANKRNSYDIRYNDGDYDRALPAEYIQHLDKFEED